MNNLRKETFLFDPTREGVDYDIYLGNPEKDKVSLLATRENPSVIYRVVGTKTVKDRTFYMTEEFSSNDSSNRGEGVLEMGSFIRPLTPDEIREIMGTSGLEGSVDAACYAPGQGEYFGDQVSDIGHFVPPLRIVGQKWFTQIK